MKKLFWLLPVLFLFGALYYFVSLRQSNIVAGVLGVGPLSPSPVIFVTNGEVGQDSSPTPTSSPALSPSAPSLNSAASPSSSSPASAADGRQRIEITPDQPFLGDPKAPLVMLEFSDFQCPFCLDYFRSTFPRIKADYIDTGKLKYIYKDFPLPIHTKAVPAALAARCAGKQGKFYPFHDALYENYAQWTAADDPRGFFKDYARRLKLNLVQFERCYSNQEPRAAIEADVVQGKELGVKGTPGFFVDGYFIPGAYSYDVFEQIFTALLAEKTAAAQN